MTHTPTPWHIGMRPGPFIYGQLGEQIADLRIDMTDENKANAQFIIKACNAHDELVKALKGVLHHNQALKEQYQLPDSLIGQIERALTKEEKD